MDVIPNSGYQYCRLPISRRLVFSAARIRELLRFGLPLQGNSVLWTIYSQVDVLILGAYANPAAIGYLSVASKIPDIFQRLGQSYTSVYLPSASSLLAAGQHHETRQILESSLRLAAFCLSWATLGAFVFGEECLIFLFSDTYAFLGFAFGLLMLTYVMTFLTNLLGYTMTAAGRPELSLVENSVRAGLTIVGDLLLIPRYGLMGAVYAGIIAACVAHPLAVGLVRKCGISIRTGLYIKQLLILIVCISLCLVLDPVGFGEKLFLFSVLPVLSYVFATVSSVDIGMLLPESLHQPLARFTQSPKMKIGLLNPGKPDGMISGRGSS